MLQNRKRIRICEKKSFKLRLTKKRSRKSRCSRCRYTNVHERLKNNWKVLNINFINIEMRNFMNVIEWNMKLQSHFETEVIQVNKIRVCKNRAAAIWISIIWTELSFMVWCGWSGLSRSSGTQWQICSAKAEACSLVYDYRKSPNSSFPSPRAILALNCFRQRELLPSSNANIGNEHPANTCLGKSAPRCPTLATIHVSFFVLKNVCPQAAFSIFDPRASPQEQWLFDDYEKHFQSQDITIAHSLPRTFHWHCHSQKPASSHLRSFDRKIYETPWRIRIRETLASLNIKVFYYRQDRSNCALVSTFCEMCLVLVCPVVLVGTHQRQLFLLSEYRRFGLLANILLRLAHFLEFRTKFSVVDPELFLCLARDPVFPVRNLVLLFQSQFEKIFFSCPQTKFRLVCARSLWSWAQDPSSADPPTPWETVGWLYETYVLPQPFWES